MLLRNHAGRVDCGYRKDLGCNLKIYFKDATFRKSSCLVNLRNSTHVSLGQMLSHCSDLPLTFFGVKKRMRTDLFMRTFSVSLEILIEY